ncbi:MAG TPA: DUF1501 domain-containing protein, partial [Pirellulaceae bacterium]|nr:DUF1501 domain-containing protein [Pirellulaceae bacterium]
MTNGFRRGQVRADRKAVIPMLHQDGCHHDFDRGDMNCRGGDLDADLRDGSLSRRGMLRRAATGFGSFALAALLGDESRRAAVAATNPLAERQPHFAPRAKRVIFLFMHGGPSHVDTFDYKPSLIRDDGKPMPIPKPRVQFAQTGNLLAPRWPFQRRGDSGLWISDLFPETARHADSLFVVNSMYTNNVVHGDAVLQLHTGSDVFVRPSMGSWITYGLGSENANLPGFITLGPSYAHGGSNNWSSAFLPAVHQGTPIGNDKSPIKEATFRHIRNPRWSTDVQRAQLDFLRETQRRSTTTSGASPGGVGEES